MSPHACATRLWRLCCASLECHVCQGCLCCASFVWNDMSVSCQLLLIVMCVVAWNVVSVLRISFGMYCLLCASFGMSCLCCMSLLWMACHVCVARLCLECHVGASLLGMSCLCCAPLRVMSVTLRVRIGWFLFTDKFSRQTSIMLLGLNDNSSKVSRWILSPISFLKGTVSQFYKIYWDFYKKVKLWGSKKIWGKMSFQHLIKEYYYHDVLILSSTDSFIYIDN